MSKDPRHKLLLRDDIRAELVRQWLSGETQRQIAEEWGYKGPGMINDAINRFMYEHIPDAFDRDRIGGKDMAREALDNYRRDVVAAFNK